MKMIGGARVEVRMPKRNKPSDFVDRQVLELIKTHWREEPCIEDLVQIAEQEMPKFAWSHDKIRNSIGRLETRGRIITKHVLRGGKACRVAQPALC